MDGRTDGWTDGRTDDSLIFSSIDLAMVMGNNGIDENKKCRKIDINFDPHAAGAIRRDAHCPMESIRGFMQSH
jgi:hypothetical protein